MNIKIGLRAKADLQKSCHGEKKIQGEFALSLPTPCPALPCPALLGCHAAMGLEKNVGCST
jgi:hypothetical protein